MRYNANMTKANEASNRIRKIENEPRFFVWFMTLILVGMSIWSIAQAPRLRQPAWAVLFVGLMILHIALHWGLERIMKLPHRTTWYVIVQGILAFSITYLSNNIGMIFCLYMALIGEGIGFLGLNRWGLLTTGFYLILSLGNYNIISGIENTIWWAVGLLPMVVFVGFYVTLYIRQFEARDRAQKLLEELEAANRQLSEYTAQVEDLTLLAERQRMARELHDTLSQGLAGLILQLEAADAHLANNRPERARAIVQQTMERARLTLGDARKAIGDLRQGWTEAGDLRSGVSQEVERFTQATGIPCELQLNPADDIPHKLFEPVLRAISEGLTNIARHAQAHQAHVTLCAAGGWLEVEIWDDGCGFDPQAGVGKSGHYGLLGMRERARLVEGTLEIESQPGSGTTLRLKLPLNGENNA